MPLVHISRQGRHLSRFPASRSNQGRGILAGYGRGIAQTRVTQHNSLSVRLARHQLLPAVVTAQNDALSELAILREDTVIFNWLCTRMYTIDVKIHY